VCYSCVLFPSFDFYFEVDPRPAASSSTFLLQCGIGVRFHGQAWSPVVWVNPSSKVPLDLFLSALDARLCCSLSSVFTFVVVHSIPVCCGFLSAPDPFLAISLSFSSLPWFRGSPPRVFSCWLDFSFSLTVRFQFTILSPELGCVPVPGLDSAVAGSGLRFSVRSFMLRLPVSSCCPPVSNHCRISPCCSHSVCRCFCPPPISSVPLVLT
jgi:hypothetical protein